MRHRGRRTTLSELCARDNVVGVDDGVHQVATMSGDPDAGSTATLAVPV